MGQAQFFGVCVLMTMLLALLAVGRALGLSWDESVFVALLAMFALIQFTLWFSRHKQWEGDS